MSREHTPSVDMALSLATPLPPRREPEPGAEEAPSALPEPEWSELHEHRDEHLGSVLELSQRIPLGDDVWLLVDWLVDPLDPDTAPTHVRHLELLVDGNRLPLRRGQIDAVTRALGAAGYIFETAEREELARRTC